MRFDDSLALLADIEQDLDGDRAAAHAHVASECQTIRAVVFALQDRLGGCRLDQPLYDLYIRAQSLVGKLLDNLDVRIRSAVKRLRSPSLRHDDA